MRRGKRADDEVLAKGFFALKKQKVFWKTLFELRNVISVIQKNFSFVTSTFYLKTVFGTVANPNYFFGKPSEGAEGFNSPQVSAS